jgi:uncharacterized protein YjdB
VPFNLTAAADWQIAYNAKPVNTACADGIPKWIIRNGVNDKAPDGNTNFANFGKSEHADANANGAVAFEITQIEAESITLQNVDTSVLVYTTTATRAAPEYTIVPANVPDQTVSWSSSKTNVATVDSTTGTVTPKGSGTVTITVTTSNGKTASYDLTVFVPVTGITLKSSSVIRDKTLTLSGTVTPSGATNKTISWSLAANTLGVTLNGSTLTAGSTLGTVQVTATIANGAWDSEAKAAKPYTTTFNISVTRPSLVSIAIFPASSMNNWYDGDYLACTWPNQPAKTLTLKVNESYSLYAVIDSADSADKITWSAQELVGKDYSYSWTTAPNTETVSIRGPATPGTYTIKAGAKGVSGGSTVSYSCTLTVVVVEE